MGCICNSSGQTSPWINVFDLYIRALAQCCSFQLSTYVSLIITKLTIDLVSLGIYAPEPQTSTHRPLVLRAVRILTPLRVPSPERIDERFWCSRNGRCPGAYILSKTGRRVKLVFVLTFEVEKYTTFWLLKHACGLDTSASGRFSFPSFAQVSWCFVTKCDANSSSALSQRQVYRVSAKSRKCSSITHLPNVPDSLDTFQIVWTVVCTTPFTKLGATLNAIVTDIVIHFVTGVNYV